MHRVGAAGVGPARGTISLDGWKATLGSHTDRAGDKGGLSDNTGVGEFGRPYLPWTQGIASSNLAARTRDASATCLVKVGAVF